MIAAVVYAERAHHAHNTLLLLSKDDPQSRGQIETEDAEECERKRQVLLSHFSAEACGLSDSESVAAAAAAAGGAVGADGEGYAWQEQEILQDPAVRNGRCAIWTQRHALAVEQMNVHFVQATTVARVLSERGGKGAAQRERAVIVEWIHSLCDGGRLEDCKNKLDLLKAALVQPLQQARSTLRAHDESLADASVDVGDKKKAQWKGVASQTLEVLEEEMGYALLRAKVEESTQ